MQEESQAQSVVNYTQSILQISEILTEDFGWWTKRKVSCAVDLLHFCLYFDYGLIEIDPVVAELHSGLFWVWGFDWAAETTGDCLSKWMSFVCQLTVFTGQDVPDGVKSLPSLHLHAPPAAHCSSFAPPLSTLLFDWFYCGLNGSVVSAAQPGLEWMD